MHKVIVNSTPIIVLCGIGQLEVLKKLCMYQSYGDADTELVGKLFQCDDQEVVSSGIVYDGDEQFLQILPIWKAEPGVYSLFTHANEGGLTDVKGTVAI